MLSRGMFASHNDRVLVFRCNSLPHRATPATQESEVSRRIALWVRGRHRITINASESDGGFAVVALRRGRRIVVMCAR